MPFSSGVGVGSGVSVGIGVDVGTGVLVGVGAIVGVGIGVGIGVGSGVSVGSNWAHATATRNVLIHRTSTLRKRIVFIFETERNGPCRYCGNTNGVDEQIL